MLAALTLLAQTVIPIPPVDLNHFHLTVDRVTFMAIQKSRWLKENFGEVTVSTDLIGDYKRTRLSVYGVGTYVELFPGGIRSEGRAGLAFLTTPGGVNQVDRHLRQGHFGNRTSRELTGIGKLGQQSPFSHLVSYSGQERTNLEVWFMAFHPDYYLEAGASVSASQKTIFAGRRSKQGKPYKGMMGDLRSVTVQPAGDGKDLREALNLLGYRNADGSDVWRRGGNEVKLLAASASAPKFGLTSARFSLRFKPKRVHVERFGPRSELRVSPDGTAEWRFGIPVQSLR